MPRRTKPAVAVKAIQTRMIAPCGINCAVCLGHLRDKNRCAGCNAPRAEAKVPHCTCCHFILCPERARARRFCVGCSRFPCRRLRQLDLRYRTKYYLSPIANLEAIRTIGLRKFVAREKARWKCPACGATLCMHRPACLRCGQPR